METREQRGDLVGTGIDRPRARPQPFEEQRPALRIGAQHARRRPAGPATQRCDLVLRSIPRTGELQHPVAVHLADEPEDTADELGAELELPFGGDRADEGRQTVEPRAALLAELSRDEGAKGLVDELAHG